MKQVLSQHLKISQNLVMTPQLQQSIKILQLSRMELIEKIKEEIESNPICEEESPFENEFETIDIEKDSESITPPENGNFNEALNDFDWELYQENMSFVSYNSKYAHKEKIDEDVNFENIVSKQTTLEEYLMWQIRMTDLPEEDLKIAEFLIYNINEDGYLEVSLEEVSATFNRDINDVKQILKEINFLDPVGIGALNLSHCLLIQMEFNKVKDNLAEDIIKNHLNLIQNKNINQLAKIYNVDEERILEVIEFINSLEPKPARLFRSSLAQTIIPDVYVVKKGDDFVIILNDDGIPKFRINEEYVESLLKKNSKKEVKDYLVEKVKNAKWLLKSIEQRERTIYKVVECILKFQREFFEKGINYLKPLILKDIAEELGLHESTISRTTHNKYISTPHGIFELKFFFNKGLSSSNGEESVSSKVVMERIKEIISMEPPNKPYSDEKISKILKEKYGINIARRTVAKYREQMKILSSSKRKKIQ